MTKFITPGRALVALLLITGVLYASTLGAPPLAWDDDSNIFANPYFKAGWWSVFWSENYFGLYVPVTSTAWHLLYDLGGGAAWPFRLVNLGLHLANIVLVYLGTRRLIGRSLGWPAVAAATVFALHPLQVGAVAWISGGRDLLATFFALLALGLYLRGPSAFGRVAATLVYVLAVLSKPSAVVLPAVVWALAARLTPNEPRRRHAPWLAGWLLVAGLIVWWTLGAQDGHLPVIAWWRRPWLMGDAYWFYLTRLVNIFGLSANYARTPATVFAWPWSLIGAGLGWITVGGLLWWRRERDLVAAWALWLLPVSGLVSFGYQETSGVADHYAYPALAFAAAALAVAWSNHSRSLGRWPVRAAAALGATALAAALVVDGRRLGTWRSNDAFFTDMARAAPAAYATALGMSSVACVDRRDYADGVRWTEVALRARPLDVRALANQAYCLLHDQKFSRVAELDFYLDRLDQETLARTEPTGYTSLLASIGSARIELGALKEGYQFLCEALRLLPTEPTHRRNLDLAAAILRRQNVTPECEADADPDDD